jgi:hypothetical protein
LLVVFAATSLYGGIARADLDRGPYSAVIIGGGDVGDEMTIIHPQPAQSENFANFANAAVIADSWLLARVRSHSLPTLVRIAHI